MKKITLSSFLLMACLYGNAQTITQSTSQTITDGTISCNAQGLAIANNSYFRYFELADDHSITTDYNITQVQFGIQSLLTAEEGSHPITVKLYQTAVPRTTFADSYATLAGISLIAEQTYVVPDQDGTIIYNADITGTVTAGNNLLVEVTYLGDTTGSTILFLGSNGLGESDPTYLMSAGEEGCGVNKPTPISTIVANSSVHLVMNVLGTSGTAGVNDNILETVSVYPNPTNGLVNIQVPGSLNVTGVTITDVAGKVSQAGLNGNTVNISGYASGVYFMDITTDAGKVTKKIVKQ